MVQLDIPMPKTCYECPCHDGENNSCQVTGKYYYDEILRSCPLIELPSARPRQTCEYWDSESNFCALCRPSAQPERKKGKWINETAFFYEGWECSACGFDVEGERQPPWHFCPNCGAKMRGEQDL